VGPVTFVQPAPASQLFGRADTDEKASACNTPATAAIRATGDVEPLIKINRADLRGDPRLPVMTIRVELRKRAA